MDGLEWAIRWKKILEFIKENDIITETAIRRCPLWIVEVSDRKYFLEKTHFCIKIWPFPNIFQNFLPFLTSYVSSNKNSQNLWHWVIFNFSFWKFYTKSNILIRIPINQKCLERSNFNVGARGSLCYRQLSEILKKLRYNIEIIFKMSGILFSGKWLITIFFRKFLKYIIEILLSWKILTFDKNRDNRKVFEQFFLGLNRKSALMIFLQICRMLRFYLFG